MPEKGGIPFDSEVFQRETLRADLAAVATAYCYEHGATIADEILSRFSVTRKPLKEQKAS